MSVTSSAGPPYKPRTLLILLAVLPPLLDVTWVKYAERNAEQERRAAIELERLSRLNLQRARFAPNTALIPDVPSPSVESASRRRRKLTRGNNL